MLEDTHPDFENNELRLAYFTLPMALNYQRDSYKLWESAVKTYNDKETAEVFNVNSVSIMEKEKLRTLLTKYKLALQPNKHIETWQKIAQTVNTHFGSFENMIKSAQNDYLNLKELVQLKYKKGFPYLSGPKIFNYWSFILKSYGGVPVRNAEFIQIAPDTHITQCSIILGVITKEEAENLSKEEISEKWREILNGSGITPIEMHPPLWFWSRNGFLFNL